MANRIDTTFSTLKSEGKCAFIAYVCAGDPNLDATLDIVLALGEAGADIIELGLPFSDPLADGIVNQMAAGRALEAGTTTAGVLGLIHRIRERSQIPLVLFTYLNPVYTYGFERFHADAAAAGADGVLSLDLPPDEAAQNAELAGTHGVCQIRLISPTTPEDRIRNISQSAQGFIYYVSREGVTGAQTKLAAGISGQIDRIRAASPVPVAVGFGISTPEQARAVAGMADGVVVGSAIVKVIATHGASPDLAQKVGDFVRPLAEAIKSV